MSVKKVSGLAGDCRDDVLGEGGSCYPPIDAAAPPRRGYDRGERRERFEGSFLLMLMTG
jgi:hypothetical protein